MIAKSQRLEDPQKRAFNKAANFYSMFFPVIRDNNKATKVAHKSC